MYRRTRRLNRRIAETAKKLDRDGVTDFQTRLRRLNAEFKRYAHLRT
jgi:hypothetical protein